MPRTLFNMDKILDKLPAPNRQNWYFETDFLIDYIKPNSKVLQIGSCDGIRIDYLANKRKDWKFIGLEIDPKLSKEANKRLKKYNGRAKSVMGDARKIPLKKKSFDYVICLNNTLGYIPDDKTVIQELKRVTKPGGKIIISVYGTDWNNRMAKNYFKTLLVKKIRITGNKFLIDGLKMKRYSRKDVTNLLGKKAKIINSVIGLVGVLTR